MVLKEFISRNNGRTVNLSIARDRDGREVFVRAPGYSLFCNSGVNSRVRGVLELNDLTFWAVGTSLISVDGSGSVTATYGPIANDNRRVWMAASPDTLMLVSAGKMYRLNAAVLTDLSASIPLGFTPLNIQFLDDYFVALADNLRQIYFDDTDGATWDPTDVQTAEADANKFVSMMVDHETLFIYGNRVTQAFVVGKNINAPFEAQKSGVVQQGIEAADAIIACGGFRFWIGQSHEGRACIYRAQGYEATRVSKDNVEAAITSYGDISDAIAWAYQRDGHHKVRFSFPSALSGAGATWEYDLTEENWTEALAWDSANSRLSAHRGFCAISAFNKILIGDRDNGKIYEFSPDFYDDDLANGGERIHWSRLTPNIRSGNNRVEYPAFYVVCKTGVGDGSNRDPNVGTVTEEADPIIAMRYSEDDGDNFSNELYRSMGAQGEKADFVTWNRQGASYERRYEVSGQAAVELVLNEAGFDGKLQVLAG